MSSVKIFETRNSSYKLGDTLEFKIPPNIPLINTSQTFLKFNVQIGSSLAGQLAAGVADPDHYFRACFHDKIGAGNALIKNLTIESGDREVVLEQILNYNMLCRLVDNYTQNETNENFKTLFEGAGKRTCLEDAAGARAGHSTAQIASLTVNTVQNKKLEVCLDLKLSGILNNPQNPFPNMLTNGLIVRIDLEDDVYKVIQGRSNQLGRTLATPDDFDNQNIALGYSQEEAYAVQNNPRINGAAATTIPIANAAIAGNDGHIINEGNGFRCPFSVGQKVRVTNGAFSVDVDVVSITFNANVTSLTFAGTDFSANPADQTMQVFLLDPPTKPKITIDKCELVCGVINLNDQQIQQYQRAVSSKGGFSYSYQSWVDFPVNSPSGAIRVSNLINSKLQRCRAVLTNWEDAGGNSQVERDNLATPLDTATTPKDYYYIYNNVKQPNRNVDLSKYSRTYNQSGNYNAIHLKELEDALNACGYRVKNLVDTQQCLAIGRSLARYNHTFNMLRSEGEFRSYINFSSQTRALLFHNYVCHIRTLMVAPQRKIVMK